MKKITARLIPALFAVMILAGTVRSAFAIPSLQLDILGGTYDSSTQTIVSSSPSFKLYAYLIPDSKALLTDTYFISVAMTPQIGPVGVDVGSFQLNGNTVLATADMVYGTPPIDSYTQASDPGDLSTHSIYPTYFQQYAFNFDSNDRTTGYDTQINTGVGPTPNSSGEMYFHEFDVDTTSLAAPYSVHFDLYSTQSGNNAASDTDINQFAPFSHDAESCINCRSTSVPEPTTMLLVGAGMLGMVVYRRKLLA
ncbi:MAG: choice-of-anchor N protein [Nitrospirae bacterium]|nr:choice-of-anchor N protein [Nitrospirota bacterium]MBI3803137.1 choice-of-anchor N protein [Candidatus Manganitrophaceae bacterium]